jgi:hypothetical protein
MTTSTPESVRICDELVERFPNAEYGPAHIVVSDHNLEDEHLISCLRAIDRAIKKEPESIAKIWELMVTRQALLKLLDIPEKKRCWWMEDE